MKSALNKLKSLIPTKRKLIQLYTALLFNANIKGFINGTIYKGDTKSVCMPGLNCYSCPGAVTACPLGSLQAAVSSGRSTLYYIGGILLLYCIMFGRFICGWLCPFGLVQELLYKIKVPKVKKNAFTRALTYLKYVILVFFVIIVPVAYAFRDKPLPAFCKYICPAGTLGGGLSLLAHKANAGYFEMLGPIFTWKFLLMVSILVACIFVFRLFCRFVCPLGALYSLFNKLSLFGVKVDTTKCTDCGLCVNHCKMDIKNVGDRECISCGDCISVCPTSAIYWKGLARKPFEGRYSSSKMARYITRGISAVLMLALLFGAVFAFWDTDDAQSTKGDAYASHNSEDAGSSERPYSMKLSVVTADGVSDQTVDPGSFDCVTVVNFWGTWCGPCVEELPHFDTLASEYRDLVTVVAVHSDLLCDTEAAFIAKYYPHSDIIFAKDEPIENQSDVYISMLGGGDTYPYTVIFYADGTIAKIFYKKLSYDELKSAVDNALSASDAQSTD